MRLLIDIGNTRIKWALLQHGRLSSQTAFGYPLEDELEAQLEQAWAAIERPDAVHMSSVARDTVTERLSRWIERKWSCPIERLQAGLRCAGVANGYAEPLRLGVDRWAAMVAAYALVNSAVCVVDCGTALTCDAIDSQGGHLGGLIAPGRLIMRHSLIDSTAGIALTEAKQTAMPWGSDTSSCVEAGWIQASVGLIERVAAELQQKVNSPVITVITGGDAEALLPWLAISYRYEADLVLQGVGRMVSESLG